MVYEVCWAQLVDLAVVLQVAQDFEQVITLSRKSMGRRLQGERKRRPKQKRSDWKKKRGWLSKSTLGIDSDTLSYEENIESEEESPCQKGKNRRQKELAHKDWSSHKEKTSKRGEEHTPSQEARKLVTPVKSRLEPREDPTIQKLVDAMAEIKIQLANIQVPRRASCFRYKNRSALLQLQGVGPYSHRMSISSGMVHRARWCKLCGGWGFHELPQYTDWCSTILANHRIHNESIEIC